MKTKHSMYKKNLAALDRHLPKLANSLRDASFAALERIEINGEWDVTLSGKAFYGTGARSYSQAQVTNYWKSHLII